MNKKRMKGIAVVMAVFLLPTTACTQDMETFDTGLFSFEYPAKYEITPINNAPHMLLKLTTDEEFFTISAWDYDLDESINAWDEKIYERYSMMLEEGEIISLDKVLIKTQNGEKKWLKMKSNTTLSYNLSQKMITYILVNEGYLFVIMYATMGTYTKYDNTKYADSLLSGLHFKPGKNEYVDREERTMAAVKQAYIDFCAEFNQQLPMTVDEITTLKSVTFANWEFTSYYSVNLDLSDFTDSELKEIMADMKKEQKDYAKMLLTQVYNGDDIVQVMKGCGMKIRMFYTDATGRVIGTIEYTYKDFDY